MLNLIPKEEKKKIIKGFYFRLLILFLLMLGVMATISFFLILPSYFLSSVKNDIATTKVEQQRRQPVTAPDQETLATIKDLNSKLILIEQAGGNTFSISKNGINTVVLKKSPGIKITDISFRNDPTNGKKLGIQGTAPSRETLLSFRQALEDDPNFKQVDLPISNFVKGQNIQFYLNLIPK